MDAYLAKQKKAWDKQAKDAEEQGKVIGKRTPKGGNQRFAGAVVRA
jgi:hypothetical protein